MHLPFPFLAEMLGLRFALKQQRCLPDLTRINARRHEWSKIFKLAHMGDGHEPLDSTGN
jgi:hypothetical protein